MACRCKSRTEAQLRRCYLGSEIPLFGHLDPYRDRAQGLGVIESRVACRPMHLKTAGHGIDRQQQSRTFWDAMQELSGDWKLKAKFRREHRQESIFLEVPSPYTNALR